MQTNFFFLFYFQNKKYFINNYTINDDDFPPIFPSLEFRLKTDIIVDKDAIVTAVIKGRIRKY